MKRKLIQTVVVALVLTSTLSPVIGGFSVSQEASADIGGEGCTDDAAFSLLSPATTAYSNVKDPCWQADIDKGNHVQIYQQGLILDSDTRKSVTQFNNWAGGSTNTAYGLATRTLAEEYQNGSAKGTAVAEARKTVKQYYSEKIQNQIANHNGYIERIYRHNQQEDGYQVVRPSTYTNSNKTEHLVAGPQDYADVVADQQNSEEGLIYNSTSISQTRANATEIVYGNGVNGGFTADVGNRSRDDLGLSTDYTLPNGNQTSLYRYLVWVENPDGVWSSEEYEGFISMQAYTSSNYIDMVSYVNPDDGSINNAYDFNRTLTKINKLEQYNKDVLSNIGNSTNGHFSNLYDGMSNGQIDPQDVISLSGWSQIDTSPGDRTYSTVQAQRLGLNSTGLNTTVDIILPAGTVLDGYKLQTQKNVSGQLFTDSDLSISQGDRLDTSNLSSPVTVYYKRPDGNYTSGTVDGELKIDDLRNPNTGEPIDTVRTVDRSVETYNTTELTDKLDKVQDQLESIRNAEENPSYGGAGENNSDGGLLPDDLEIPGLGTFSVGILIVGVIALLIVLSVLD